MELRALIVEDEVEHLHLLALLLQRRGYQVFQERNGNNAWDLLRREPIPLVLTDWMMPGMEGPELIRRIRSAGLPYYTYIVMLTARSNKPDVVEGIESGADDYLTKPFEPDELFARLTIAERILRLEMQLRQKSEQLERMATYDMVTGLFNRRAMYDAALKELERSRQNERPVALAMFDLDHFKLVNDHFGHDAGDEALRLIAQVVSEHLRPYDLVGRWGGEEFLVLMPGADLEAAQVIAERLRQAIQAHPLHINEKGVDYPLRASFGVACAEPQPEITLERLIQQADEALYAAKDGGRNRVCGYRPVT